MAPGFPRPVHPVHSVRKGQACEQFEQDVPEGTGRLSYWPVEAFFPFIPKYIHGDQIVRPRGLKRRDQAGLILRNPCPWLTNPEIRP